MNILFVVDSLSIVAGANVNIVRTINRILKEKKNRVYVLAKSDCRRPSSIDVEKEFEGAYLLPSDKMEIIPGLYNKIKTPNKRIKELIWIANHPGILWKAIDIKYLDAKYTRKEYIRNIEKICTEKKIHVVIGISAPYNIARAVGAADIKAMKTLYQMDPFTNNYTLSTITKEKRRKIEKRTLDQLELIFQPDFVRQDIISNNVYPDCKKIIEVNLPGIILDKLTLENSQKKKINTKKDVVFVYAGKMYKDIRNPRPLLQLFEYLPDNYILHIFGSGCEKEIFYYQNILKNRLKYHGLVSKEEADEYIEKSDVLVNIDNVIKNQMPSKILNYISQQKKIMNICSDCECLAAKLLSYYPNGINILINEEDPKENAEKIELFIKEEMKTISTEWIIEHYKEYTDEYVVKTITNAISERRRLDDE